MRTGAIGPSTWLLLAIAVWALMVWALALQGMGSNIRPLAADPGQGQALPELRPPTASRFGSFAQYSAIGAHPLFSESRRPEAFFITGDKGAEQVQTFDFLLSGVLIAPSLRMAILQPKAGGESVRVRLGEAPRSAPGWRIVEIKPTSVVTAGPDGRQTLELRRFDGPSGQPPDAVPSSPLPPAAATDGNGTAESNATTGQRIRKRIEERRVQLREQAEFPPTPDKTK